MGFFSKLKKTVVNTLDPAELIKRDKKKRPAVAIDPDPINPLTGRPRSQDLPRPGIPSGDPVDFSASPPAYLPPPVSIAQRVPQGLGSDVFRSTLAPLQQQGYGLGQVDPRFLTGAAPQPGGSNAAIPFAPAGQPFPRPPVQQGLGSPMPAPQPIMGLGQIDPQILAALQSRGFS